MIRSYIKIAWRNIFRQKLFSLINILGLAVALSAFFLIIQYVGFERSYDRFHQRADEVYRVNTTRSEGGRVIYSTALSPANAGPFLKEQFNEVETFTRLLSMQFNFVCAVSYTDGNRTVTFNERNVYYGDHDFFTVFSFPLQAGDMSTALSAPFTVVISQDAARKYFGDRDPLGQTLRFINSYEEHDYRVTGVLGHAEGPSHIVADFLFSYPSLMNSAFREDAHDNWDADAIYTYIQSDTPLSSKAINEKLRLNSHILAENQSDIVIDLRPITSIHLTGSLQDEPSQTGSQTLTSFLLVIAGFIVALAWINYANLAIADALRRTREVGLRKIIGANRWQIVAQFFAQFMLMNILALALCCALVPAATPSLQKISGVSFDFHLNALPMLPLLAFFVLGLLTAGGYPAYVLSRLNPGHSIRGTYVSGPRHTFTRHLLVGFQFCVSMALVTATVIVHRQMNFMQDADLGMTIKNTVVVRAPISTDTTSGFRMRTFRDALMAQPKVQDVVLSVAVPAGEENSWTAEIRRNKEDKVAQSAWVSVIDQNFIEMYGIQLLAGRDFLSSDYRTWEKFGDQTESVMINESVVSLLGFGSPAAAIGQAFYWGEDRCMVVGVIDNFHSRSLQYEMKPELFLLDRNGTNLSIRTADIASLADRQEALMQIETAYREFFPNDPFEYFFLEDRFDDQYLDDRRFSMLLPLFSVLAICIAWLGLAGLVAFFLLHRRKEIGIRKVLGATVASILRMVSKGYVKQGLIALVIMIPVTHYFITRWLERYAYHIDLDIWTFGVPGLVVLVAAVVVVIGQAMKSAMANPAEAIRSE